MKLTKVYLAIPYRGIGIENSFKQATEATAELISMGGHNIFSPITHSHPLTPYNIKGDWDTWKYYDYQFIDWCDELWVLIPNEGYESVLESIGVQEEIKYATKLKKSVMYVKVVEDGIIRKSTHPNTLE